MHRTGARREMMGQLSGQLCRANVDDAEIAQRTTAPEFHAETCYRYGERSWRERQCLLSTARRWQGEDLEGGQGYVGHIAIAEVQGRHGGIA